MPLTEAASFLFGMCGLLIMLSARS